ncbi:aspartate 1-decarboxylase [Desulfovibrio litoralis]|uniref:Aspartate 1-decarboxylase n=1 Tax=Desulfovibrio litoralis DSM 11393 TaxID=1121455 RepID=A0A1M7ST94_9BACT|nr:aspartate 1-decarboxylase [Desulfovibrio litoralis]SHN61600.1 L-aspartate 1-decarboxylase [Desulfovibrio litoralis DSM 11393]
MIKIIRAKLHGIKITDASLNYRGSITLDPVHCRKAGIYPLEYVDIWNKTNGNRISTYVIYGEEGSNCCILNGAAARTCQPGDEVIISASMYITNPKELYDIKPTVLIFDENNNISEVMQYNVYKNNNHDFNFNILTETDNEE